MPFNGKKTFICDVLSCRQSFCSADKLSIHKKNHKVPPLVFPAGETRSDQTQGPQADDTPARFTKLLDAAGLVQDLSNPFDASFRKAGENPPSLNMIDSSELSTTNVLPPTTADILQEVVEQEQPLWKHEGCDQRTPVITTRSSALPMLTELSENVSRSNNDTLDGITIKSSGSPAPDDHLTNPSHVGMVGFNPVIMKPMMNMLHHPNSAMTLNRHFSTHFTSSSIHLSEDPRAQTSMMISDSPASSNQTPSRVAMKRKSNGSSDDEEERKRKFRENNKLAAQRCRQRKKQEIEDTRKERDRLREENQKLAAKLELCLQNDEKLRDQVEKLKIELAEHAQCNVSLKKRGVIQYPGP